MAGALVALTLVACKPAGTEVARTDAVASDWLKAHNAGQAEWAADFYAPDALIRDADGVTFRGAGAASAWERLTSGLYRYEVVSSTWTDADTLLWEVSASPVQFIGPPRHFRLTVRDGRITGFDWFAADRQTPPTTVRPGAADGAAWPLSVVGAAAAAVVALGAIGTRRRARTRSRVRLKLLESLRAFAEARRDG